MVQTPYGAISDALLVGEGQLMCAEDSRVLRIFDERRYVERVLTNHGAPVTRLAGLAGSIVVSGSGDGALKCILGVRK